MILASCLVNSATAFRRNQSEREECNRNMYLNERGMCLAHSLFVWKNQAAASWEHDIKEGKLMSQREA